MNLLKNDLLMRKTGDRRRTELTEESASQCGLSAEFITPSRVLPRWCGVLFILLMPVTIFLGSILPSAYSTIWSGLAWLALGYGLWSHSGAAAEQPLRVR